MKILLFVAAGVLAAAPSVRLDPAVITACQNGSGQATVFWDGAGAAPVTLFAGDSPMTGAEATTGSTRTGVWVTDGMVFTLRNASGDILASATASLKCETGSYWPLDLGNEWHFRVNDRIVTGAHAVWRVAAKEEIDGVIWSVLNPGPYGRTLLRNDSDGRLYRLTDDGRDVLLFDPTGLLLSVWVAGAPGPEISWRGPIVGLSQETGRLAKGIGPTYYQTNVIAGSSGGFGSGYTLLETVIAGVRTVPSYPGLELTLETRVANLSAKKVRNCAIPCYFTACFGADLPTTYKPCMEVSVRGGSGKLTLSDASGNSVYESLASDGWFRIPLYREPATVLPAGKYNVTATVNGSTMILPLEIQ